jgi:glucan phosphoethanolaminetransferase (alkaline phosphatase superfamily)
MLGQLSLRDIWYRIGLGLLAVLLGGGLGFAIISLDNPILAIAAVGGIIFAFFTVTNSEFGLLVLVFMIYTRFSDVMVKSYKTPSVLQPYLLLVLVGIVARWVFHRELSRDWMRVTAFVLAYAVVVFSSLFYASNFAIAQRRNDYNYSGCIDKSRDDCTKGYMDVANRRHFFGYNQHLPGNLRFV